MTIREIENAFKNKEILNPDSETVTEVGYRAILALATALNNGWKLTIDYDGVEKIIGDVVNEVKNEKSNDHT